MDDASVKLDLTWGDRCRFGPGGDVSRARASRCDGYLDSCDGGRELGRDVKRVKKELSSWERDLGNN